MHKILMCIPVYEGMKPIPLSSILNFIGYCKDREHEGKYLVRPMIGGPRLTTAAIRNAAVKAVLKTNTTHLLFIDDDMVVPVDLLDYLLEWDVPIVGPVFCRSTGRRDVLAFRYIDQTVTEVYDNPNVVQLARKWGTPLVEVEAFGTGAMLIRRDVLATMMEKDLYRPRIFLYPESGIGMDVFFCQRARALGFSAYVDTRVFAGQQAPGEIVYPDTGQETLTEEEVKK